mmetsp:Transcript_37122/g.60116  ORF Transcript_37122/g.60116 Transcript_37122/m.60116 type:complete len:116 (+) Transcript_37122:294-641(+)
MTLSSFRFSDEILADMPRLAFVLPSSRANNDGISKRMMLTLKNEKEYYDDSSEDEEVSDLFEPQTVGSIRSDEDPVARTLSTFDIRSSGSREAFKSKRASPDFFFRFRGILYRKP